MSQEPGKSEILRFAQNDDRVRSRLLPQVARSTFALVLGIVTASCLLEQPRACAEVVVFPDPGLDTAIREAINKPTGDILDIDLVGTGFTNLYAGGRDIPDLTGLEYCTDLTEIGLNTNQISDLSPLASLTDPNLLG